MKFGDENRYEAIEKKKENPKVIWITEFPKKDEVALIPTYTSVSNVVNNEHQEKHGEMIHRHARHYFIQILSYFTLAVFMESID